MYSLPRLFLFLAHEDRITWNNHFREYENTVVFVEVDFIYFSKHEKKSKRIKKRINEQKHNFPFPIDENRPAMDRVNSQVLKVMKSNGENDTIVAWRKFGVFLLCLRYFNSPGTETQSMTYFCIDNCDNGYLFGKGIRWMSNDLEFWYIF